MIPNHHMLSPEVATSSLTLAVEVFAQWQAGKVVVLDKSGITLDGNIWKQFTAGSDSTNQPVNTFKLQDGKWIVGFEGTETQFKDLVSFKYIHLLLTSKAVSVSHFISVVNRRGSGPDKAKKHDIDEGGHLEGLNIQTESKGERLTKDAHNEIRAGLPELKRELKLLRDAEEYERAEELEENIEKIEQQLKKAYFGNLERPYSSQYKRDLDAVRLAVNRAIKSIGTVNPALAWHLTLSIKFGAQCVYRPEKPVPWNL